jgi:hypothetical protein
LDQREKFTKCVSHESTDVKTRATKLSFLSLEIILEIQNGAQRRGERREERGERREEGERKERVKLKQKMKASLKQDGNTFGTTRSEIKKQNQEAFEEQQRNKFISYNKFNLILCTVIHRNNQFIDPELDAPPIDPHKSIQNNTTQHKTKHASEQ